MKTTTVESLCIAATRETRDARAWRELIRTMPLEVQRAIAYAPESFGQIDVVEPGALHPAAGMMVVEFLPSRRAALFEAGKPDSMVTWGELLPGDDSMLFPVYGRNKELIRGLMIDLRGGILGSFTPKEFEQLRQLRDVLRAVEAWAQDRELNQSEAEAIIKLLDHAEVPTEDHLDRLLATVRARESRPLSVVAEA